MKKMTFKRDPIWDRYTSNDGQYFISRWEGRNWKAHYRDNDGARPIFAGTLSEARKACNQDASRRDAAQQPQSASQDDGRKA